MVASEGDRSGGGDLPRDPLIGSLLHGARLEALVGEGAAARVYRATHVVLKRRYAVKVLYRPGHESAALIERFNREAEALSRMRHENVVRVVGSGVTSDRRPFLTMEYLSGQTLQAAMRDGPLPRHRIVSLAGQVALGLAEVHRHGLVHRDLKPSNVMLVEEDGREIAKLLDFGIARITDEVRRPAHLTANEALLGTPRYMAPEQMMNPRSVGPATDIYALGVILYEMLAGRPPFEGSVLEVLDQHFSAPPPPLFSRTGLESIAFSLLEKEPGQRIDSAAHVAQQIFSAPDTSGLDVSTVSLTKPTHPPFGGADRTTRDLAPLGAYGPEARIQGLVEDSETEPVEDGPRTYVDETLDGVTELDLSAAEVMAEVEAPTAVTARPAITRRDAPTKLRIVDDPSSAGRGPEREAKHHSGPPGHLNRTGSGGAGVPQDAKETDLDWVLHDTAELAWAEATAGQEELSTDFAPIPVQRAPSSQGVPRMEASPKQAVRAEPSGRVAPAPFPMSDDALGSVAFQGASISSPPVARPTRAVPLWAYALVGVAAVLLALAVLVAAGLVPDVGGSHGIVIPVHMAPSEDAPN